MTAQCIATSALAAIVLAASAQAQSACPTGPADLDTGIRATFAGYAIEYRHAPDGQIWEYELTEGANDGLVLVSRDAVFLTATYSTFGGTLAHDSLEAISYRGGIARVPPLVPGYDWAGTTTRRFPDGHTETDPIRVSAGPSQPVTLGGCAYQGFTVDVTTGAPGSDYTDRMLYLPALGMAVYLGGGNTPALVQEEYPGQFVAIPATIPGLAPPVTQPAPVPQPQPEGLK